jgi:hypothetical protein
MSIQSPFEEGFSLWNRLGRFNAPTRGVEKLCYRFTIAAKSENTCASLSERRPASNRTLAGNRFVWMLLIDFFDPLIEVLGFIKIFHFII